MILHCHIDFSSVICYFNCDVVGFSGSLKYYLHFFIVVATGVCVVRSFPPDASADQ